MAKEEKLELRSGVVTPGEDLGRAGKGDFTYVDEKKQKASVFGLKNEKGGKTSIIPFAGQYTPKEGDMIVGLVTDIVRTGWLITYSPAYTAYLNHEKRRDDDGSFDIRRIFREGDILSVKISRVDEIKNAYADGPRRLKGGRVITVNAKKIPRVIGSKKSMLNMMRDITNCRIVVGQNGIIWIDGPEENTNLVISAIRKIESESHTTGLTDRIANYLNDGMDVLEGKDKKSN